MAACSEGGTSSPDLYIALCLLLSTLISTPLNSLVFLHNYKKSSSIARTLYMGLATVDQLACLAIPISFSVGALAGKEEQCWDIYDDELCDEQYYLYVRFATTAEQIRGIMVWVLATLPCHITGFLAVTRYYQIKYPLRYVNKKLVLCLLISSCFYNIITLATFNLNPDSTVYWSTSSQTPINGNPHVFGYHVAVEMYFAINILMIVIIQFAAVVASFLTILELLKNYRNPITEGTRAVSIRGSVKIIITNFGSVFVLVELIYITIYMKNFDQYDIGMTDLICSFCGSVVIPIGMSTMNPIIYIAFTPKCSVVSSS